MPEKGIHIWEFITGVGAVFSATLWGTVRFFAGHTRKLEKIESEFSQYKEDVAKTYPSHKAMQACSDNIAKSMDDNFEKHTSDMKLVIHDAIDALEEKIEKRKT